MEGGEGIQKIQKAPGTLGCNEDEKSGEERGGKKEMRRGKTRQDEREGVCRETGSLVSGKGKKNC